MSYSANSIENGPQAIDISNTKDIFSASTSVDSLVALISHEFGIYLLIKILDGTEAFQDLSLYHQTEALAEFYNRKILNRNHKWKWDEGIIRTYEEIYMKNPSITPRELFLSQMKNKKWISLCLSVRFHRIDSVFAPKCHKPFPPKHRDIAPCFGEFEI